MELSKMKFTEQMFDFCFLEWIESNMEINVIEITETFEF